ncbi:(d)CMP kinase [Desulfococcus sp.]|uniref:(d)CMP kinase n=1 Tax=Desulfococcus sp. TaxID=2025834 RepID=UPI0035937921
MKPLLITIDGPAGAGKTTVSRAVADHLSYTYVDTGALYRAIAVAAKDAGISTEDDGGLEALSRTLSLDFAKTEAGTRLLLNGTDITDRIRTPDISMGASRISARPVIRKYLLNLQRRLGKGRRVVFEGRDMGTVVFPQADIKFFLHADLKVRAARRFEESRGKTAAQDFDTVEKEMTLRDQQDSSRSIAPLKPAEDAVIIDSTALSVEEVVKQIISHIHQKFGPP